MTNLITILIVLISLTTDANAFQLNHYGNFKFKQENQNVYIMHGPTERPNKDNEGFVNNPSLIVSKHGLIVIDPGGNYNIGKKVLTEIEKISKKPIIAIINTDKYGNHWFANKSIKEKYPNVKIYAHSLMIKENKDGFAQKRYNILNKLDNNLKGTKEFSYPQYSLKDNQKLTIDNEHFIIHHPNASHTKSDIIIEHVNSQTIFLGVNLLKNCLGTFDSKSSILGNIELLENIKNGKEFKLYVPSHGESGNLNTTLMPFLNYLEILKEEAKKAYDSDLNVFEIKPQVMKRLHAYHNWNGYQKKIGKHLTKLYSELIKRDLSESE